MNSERTQIARWKVSAPTRWILGHVDLSGKRVLHHGEGKAFLDTEAMILAGGFVSPYDPNTSANNPEVFEDEWDIAISNYVFNTLTLNDRIAAWREVLACSQRVLVAVRTDASAIDFNNWYPNGDGWITMRGTFQCIQDVPWWVKWLSTHSPDRTSVSLLHQGSGFAIIDVWR